MAGFLYFFPSKQGTTLTRSDLIGIDFPHYDRAALPGCAVNASPCSEQPRGFVFAVPGRRNGLVCDPSPIGFYPDLQEWRCAGKYWIGWMKGGPPRPCDLERAVFTKGHPIKLLDGNEWLVPAVIEADPGGGMTCGLPAVYGLNDRGEKDTRVMPQYESLWDQACQIMTILSMTEADDDDQVTYDMTYDESFEMVARALGVNYLVSDSDLRVLGLMTKTELMQCCDAICDMPTFRRLQKAFEDSKKNE